MNLIDENQVEEKGIEYFIELGYEYKNGYDISPDGSSAERDEFRETIKIF